MWARVHKLAVMPRVEFARTVGSLGDSDHFFPSGFTTVFTGLDLDAATTMRLQRCGYNVLFDDLLIDGAGDLGSTRRRRANHNYGRGCRLPWRAGVGVRRSLIFPG